MAIFTVTNLDDSGSGSLRQAIEDANATVGLDTIEFDEELSGQKITLTSGELQIADDLTISGLGADELTVSGNNSSRVFNVNDGNDSDRIEVLLEGLTIADGFTDDQNEGSGIENLENLTVTNSTISGNSGIGIKIVGDIGVDDRYVSGMAKITNSSISGNEVGIYIEGGNSTSGNAEISNSSIFGNESTGIIVDFNGLAEVSDSNIFDNMNGIGAVENGLAKVGNTTISDNVNTGVFGFRASGEVANSTITGNGGIGISLFRSSVDVTKSTISDNGDAGISLATSSVDVTKSTISGNVSTGITLGGFFSGADVTESTISDNGDGGLRVADSRYNTAEVTNSTITGNTTTTSDGGGGIYVVESDDDEEINVEIENTIIAGNFDNSSAGSDLKPDVSGTFTSNGYNLIGDGTGSTGFDGPGDQVGTSENPIDPLLGPLQDNGGPTQTQTLLTGSSAIDAGNPDFEPPPEFDQRGTGFPRVLDGNGDGTATVDIGAFEFAPLPPPPGEPIFGTPEDDELNIFDGSVIVFAGDGNDLVDASQSTCNNQLFGGKGDDELFASSNDRLFGEAGKDILNAAVGTGNNRLYGGDDNDILFAGVSDRLFGGNGDDLLFAGDAESLLNGGQGADQFWIANAALPSSPNTITDFELDVDVLGIGGLGFNFDDLSITQQGDDALIAALDTDIAILTGIQASDLDSNNFVFI